MGHAPLYQGPTGMTTYTLDDLIAPGDGEVRDPIATADDMRVIETLELNGEYTIDLGACGQLRLKRIA